MEKKLVDNNTNPTLSCLYWTGTNKILT